MRFATFFVAVAASTAVLLVDHRASAGLGSFLRGHRHHGASSSKPPPVFPTLPFHATSPAVEQHMVKHSVLYRRTTIVDHANVKDVKFTVVYTDKDERKMNFALVDDKDRSVATASDMVLNGKPFVVKSRDVPGGVPVFSKTHFEKRDDGKSQAGFSRYKQVSCIDELTFALENDQIRCSKPTTTDFVCQNTRTGAMLGQLFFQTKFLTSPQWYMEVYQDAGRYVEFYRALLTFATAYARCYSTGARLN